MWHDLNTVAQSHRLEPEAFAEFVKTNFRNTLDDFGMVQTRDVEYVIKAYKINRENAQ